MSYFRFFILTVMICSGGTPAFSDDPRKLTDKELCNLAVKGDNWDTHRYFTDYVYEANRRKISCGLSKAAPRRPPGPMHLAFLKLSATERKKLQEALKESGSYSGEVDGLYGKQTANSLSALNSQTGNRFKLTKKDEASELISLILANTPLSVTDFTAKLKEREIGSTAQTETDLGTPKIKAIAAPEEEPVKPIGTLDDMRAAYNSKDYSVAKKIAEALAVDGKAEAQLLLGKMYADGRGTIQVSTAAHMWFNIASMNGSDQAYEQRKAVTAQMTPSAVEKAQAMAMTCIQSAYTDCGLTVKPVASKAEAVAKAEIGLGSLKSHFKEQPLLKRKQIQYALKKLGVYSSSVDGAWGNGTATAVSNYQNIQNMQTNSPSELYDSVLSKVEVPSSFSAPKKAAPKKKVDNSINSGGLTAIVASPSMSGAQALAVCEPQASLAKSQASSGYRSPSYGNTVRCSGVGYSINCNSSANSGGFAGGFADGLAKGIVGKKAYKNVMNSCLASFGWRK